MSSFDLNSQTVKVTPEFRKCILALDSAHYTHNYYLPATSFEKLSVKETNNWLVYYYASLCNVLIAFTKTGDQIEIITMHSIVESEVKQVKKNEHE